jgi:hypothetical protein
MSRYALLIRTERSPLGTPLKVRHENPVVFELPSSRSALEEKSKKSLFS